MFSKSDYTRGLQCPKMLWMRFWMPERADESLKSQALIDQGHEVGDLAKGYFGPYAEIVNNFDYPKMEAETRAMLMTASYGLGPTSVCEACFTHDGLVCMADIVRFDSEGKPHLVEVKSSTKAKPNHIDDAAFQAYVMQKCGWEPASVSIMHIDGTYVREGEIDVHRLFALDDVTADVMARMDGIASKVLELRATARQLSEPDIEIGRHCNSPHPCPFQGWCWRDMPEKSVFDLAGVGRTRGWSWWEKGVRTYSQAIEAMRPNGLREAQASQSELARPDMLRGAGRSSRSRASSRCTCSRPLGPRRSIASSWPKRGRTRGGPSLRRSWRRYQTAPAPSPTTCRSSGAGSRSWRTRSRTCPTASWRSGTGCAI